MATTETERSDFSAEMATVTERLQDSANARTVFGDPVERDGRTVIPVARVAYGFGGGFGDQPGDAEGDEGEEVGAGTGGAGAGMGGGAMAKPVGALEVTDHETRFVPVGGARRWVVVLGAFLAGLLLGSLGKRRGGE